MYSASDECRVGLLNSCATDILDQRILAGGGVGAFLYIAEELAASQATPRYTPGICTPPVGTTKNVSSH